MTCEESTLLLSARMDGELSVEENKALEAHLASCQECRALAAQLEEVRSAFDGLEELPAPEGFADRVMERVTAPRVVPLFRRPAVRAVLGLAACLVLCVGLFRTDLFHMGEAAVPFAAQEGAGAKISAPCEQCTTLLLERLPEGEAARGLNWEADDGVCYAAADRETLEALMALAQEQDIPARLEGELEAGGPLFVRIDKP